MKITITIQAHYHTPEINKVLSLAIDYLSLVKYRESIISISKDHFHIDYLKK